MTKDTVSGPLDPSPAAGPARSTGSSHDAYVVVARRYRPQSFEDLVGQQQVSTALRNAITTNRVGHAYLFTGARGVGKTSCARILAKALNCQQGPTATPCDQCDICRGIVAGDDVDVLEIDGASNRGIDEIRQLRSNVNVRPGRSRFKIYIIDEVHMLTTPAFNALLKTLEEPPEHVKFIFCTTDPEKIPITVLSRCQRFDFAPVESGAIMDRLRHIVESEQVEADDDALHALARRAAGSMRDSQSLLEQLLAFCGNRIRLEDVHRMLGTAQSGRLQELAQSLLERDAAATLNGLDVAVAEGVDLGQLAEQLLGYFRDMMAAVVGCDSQMLLYGRPEQHGELAESGRQWGLPTILAAAQILDHTLGRLRQTTQVRTLVEMALVRICNLENLQQIAELAAQLESGSTLATAAPAATTARPPASRSQPARSASSAGASSAGASSASQPRSSATPNSTAQPAEKKTTPPIQNAAEAPVEAVGGMELRAETVEAIWKQTLDELGDMTADLARRYVSLAISAPNHLVARFSSGYTVEACSRAERKTRLEQTLSRVAGRPVRVDFEVVPETPQSASQVVPPRSRRQRMRELEHHPFVKEAIELFAAEVTRVDQPAIAAEIAGDDEGTPG